MTDLTQTIYEDAAQCCLAGMEQDPSLESVKARKRCAEQIRKRAAQISDRTELFV